MNSTEAIAVLTKKSEKREFDPGVVLPGSNSQTINRVGVHWLRMSFLRQQLEILKEYIDIFFGESAEDARTFWGYEYRFYWVNGVTIQFDKDKNRSDEIHNGKVTLDCPGGCLDELADDDLLTLINGLHSFSPVCSRIDLFFDDYRRIIAPNLMHDIIHRKDYSGFKQWGIVQRGEGSELMHDEINFGRRGEWGSGKYLRVYDKFLESKGEQNCVRWEVEFSGGRAKDVYDKLGSSADLTVFATLCGALIGGCIMFVKRTGEKNLNRLEVYDFWQEIQKLLGFLRVRIKRESTDRRKMFDWIEKQISPTLTCLYRTFTDNSEFTEWLYRIIDDGDFRLKLQHRNVLAKYGKRTTSESDRFGGNYAKTLAENGEYNG